MYLLLDTSTSTCKLTFADGSEKREYVWQADRKLADGLFDFLQSKMYELQLEWKDLKGIGVLQGPGSFTGLRIGMTVLNTIADDQAIPIVGATGENWQQQALHRLQKGENDGLVMPVYGREANITKPRK